jgi:phosphatidylserine decarboxylase
MTPGTVTPGAITPGGRRRRPIFRKHKSRGTHYNFSNENDILGIVMLEVQGAEDLPKLRNCETKYVD